MSLKTVSVAPGGGGGNGTVTNVSITTANGVSGAVANSTTTPAITLTLGDITPTSVALNGNTYATSKAARNFQLGQADASTALTQTLSVQSVVAGTSNTAGANFTITGSQGTGTGAGGAIIFQVAPAGSSGTAQNGLVNALTIGNDRSLSFNGTLTAALGVPQTVVDFSIQPYPKLKTPNFSYYSSNSSGAYYYVSPGYIEWRTADTGGFITAFNLEAAGTYAQRNGTNSQAFRVYNTYTDASNYERGIFEWYSNTLYIGTQNAGSGSARNLQFIVGGNAIADYGITYPGAFNFTSSTAAGGAHFINNTATLYTGCAYFFAPNTTAGGNTAMFIGVANTTKNSFSLSFTYAGSGSTSNAIVFQFNGIAPPALSINSAGLAAFGDLLSTSPALKPSSTTLQVRLGNDSAFTAIQGKLTTDTAYTAGVLVPTGYITIYDSTGTAYRVPCLV